MVKLILVIEGGTPTHPNNKIEETENRNILREGFYRLFEREIPRKHLDIRMAGSWTGAKAIFNKIYKDDKNACLIVDSDAPDDKKEDKRKERKLEPKEAIFFMVQEMEAWFLSQPDKIEEYYEDMSRHKETPFAQEIKMPPKEFNKPNTELVNIIVEYFYKEGKDGNLTPKYRKPKDGGRLLELLDLSKLKEDFEDVHRLINTLQTKIANA